MAWRGMAARGVGRVRISLTPETLPFILMGFGMLGLAWIVGSPRDRFGEAFLRAAIAFALVIAASFAVDPPASGYGAIEIDRLSIVYAALAVAILSVGVSLTLLDRLAVSQAARRVAGAVVSALSRRMAHALPKCARRSGRLDDARRVGRVFGPIGEMRQVDGARDVLIYLSSGLFATAAAGVFAWRRRSIRWAYAALCGTAVTLFGALHIRFSPYGQAMAAMMLPVTIAAISRAVASRSVWKLRLAGGGIFASVVFIPWVAVLSASGASATAASLACSLRQAAISLAPYAGQTVIASPNDTPELLWRTQLHPVGGLYHRDIAGLMRLRNALFSRPWIPSRPKSPQPVRAWC